MALLSFVESAPRAYRLKVGNADLFRNSTEPGTSPDRLTHVDAVDLANQRSKPQGLTTVAAANHHNSQFVADRNEPMNGLDSS
jgi:hypothetical protein